MYVCLILIEKSMVTNKKALVVGIDLYDGPRIQDLGGCTNDAKEVSKLLEDHEDKELGKNFHVDYCENLRTNDLKLAIRKLLRIEECEKGEKESVREVVFYFAGHGYIDENGGYLLGKDARNSEPGVSMGWLNKMTHLSKIEDILIILDCCHAGEIANELNENTEISRLRRGVTILAASTKNQAAGEEQERTKTGKLKTHGVFTKIIAEGLKGAAVDLNGNVTAAALYRHADESLSIVRQQRPVYKSFVDEMKSIRICKVPVRREDLLKINKKGFFIEKDQKIPLTIDMIPKKKEQEGVNDYVVLSVFEKAGLLSFSSQNTLLQAALREEVCFLNLKGKFIWEKVRSGNY